MQLLINCTPYAVLVYCLLAVFVGYHLGYERGLDEHYRKLRRKRREAEKKLPRAVPITNAPRSKIFFRLFRIRVNG